MSVQVWVVHVLWHIDGQLISHLHLSSNAEVVLLIPVLIRILNCKEQLNPCLSLLLCLQIDRGAVEVGEEEDIVLVVLIVSNLLLGLNHIAAIEVLVTISVGILDLEDGGVGTVPGIGDGCYPMSEGLRVVLQDAVHLHQTAIVNFSHVILRDLNRSNKCNSDGHSLLRYNTLLLHSSSLGGLHLDDLILEPGLSHEVACHLSEYIH